MSEIDFRSLPREVLRREWALAIGAAALAAAAVELAFIAGYGDRGGAIWIPLYLGFVLAVVASVAVVMLDRETRGGEQLLGALAASGDPVFAVLESRALHAALGTRRSSEEMVQSVGVAVVSEFGLQVWAAREGRARELAVVTWDRVAAIGAGEVRQGHRRTRAIMLELDGGERSLPLIIASRDRRWFGPADDASFSVALTAMGRRGL